MPTTDYNALTDDELRQRAADAGVTVEEPFDREKVIASLTEVDDGEANRTRTRGGQSQTRAGDTPGQTRNQPGVKGEGRASEGNKGGNQK